jgi:hypothetical protein
LQTLDKTEGVIENGQTRDIGSIETRCRMDKPETQAALRQDTEWTNQRHRQYWNKSLWFGHSLSCPNTVCVSGLSILCLVLILHVSLACPFCILSQNCLCLWLVHFVSCLNTACVSGLSILHLVTRLPVSLVCPFCVLSQYCLCLCFVHSASCFNIACVSGLSILCLVSILPVSLVCPSCYNFLKKQCLILLQTLDKTERVIENGQTRDIGSIETRCRMDKPETQAVLRQDT